MNKKIPTGRLAPSPTGFLHLGNAWSFLWAWAAVRTKFGQVILRIEDIDQTRSRPEYVTALIEDLQWLGLDWDLGPTLLDPQPNYFQSSRHQLYEQALARLAKEDLTYPCFCTRKELKMLASATHLDDEGLFYPGTCRKLNPNERQARLKAGQKAAIRLKCPLNLDPISFHDRFLGRKCFTPTPQGYDLPLRRSDGVIAYQLACVIDDAAMGVTQVLRGRDLINSTPRQILLAQLLGIKPISDYAHIPLLLDAMGERLAKRHQSLTIRSLRANHVLPEQIIGLLAFLAGINDSQDRLKIKEILPRFDQVHLSGPDIRITPDLLANFGIVTPT